MGAITLAAIGTGIYSNFNTASTALAQYSTTYHPDAKQAEAYLSLFEIYKDAIDTNANLGKRLTQLGDC